MSDRAGSFDIYVANADGSDVRRLTDDPGNDFTQLVAGRAEARLEQ
jgi:Tol biopolymer transport system component